MSTENIADASKPNSGRVYDYLLGGHHNFEVDRRAAEQVTKLMPFVPKAARLQRWCLQDIATELTVRRGFDVIIDFASGLPTNDHIHQAVPEGTTVIYSDYDPVTVEYGRTILGNVPNVHFFLADARRPEDLLNRPEVQKILNGRRNVALIHWSVLGFMSDQDLTHVAHYFHEWAGDKSCWVLNLPAADADPNDPAWVQLRTIYERMGTPGYYRSVQQCQELIQPWHADEKGFISLLEWHGFDETEMSKEDRKAWGPGGPGYGVYLVK